MPSGQSRQACPTLGRGRQRCETAAMRSRSALLGFALATAQLAAACSGRDSNDPTRTSPGADAPTLAAGETVPWVDIPAPLSSAEQPPIPELGVILAAPATVRAGDELRYEVTFRNAGAKTFAWTGACPVFLATLQTPPPEPKNVTGNHQQLNCGRARDLGPGEQVTFEMRLSVPKEVPAGQWILTWSFTKPGSAASPPAKANLTIER